MMVSSATILGVTGILVSGVIGPSVAAYFGRRAEGQRATRDLMQRRRDDLRVLVDEGAVLLGRGETNLRVAHEVVSRGDPEPDEIREWAGNVHLLGQRLLLRVPADDPVAAAYEDVRHTLLAVGAEYGNDEQYKAAVAEFETRRSAFLDEARAALDGSETL